MTNKHYKDKDIFTLANQTPKAITVLFGEKACIIEFNILARNAANTKTYADKRSIVIGDGASANQSNQTSNNGFTFTTYNLDASVDGEVTVNIETDAAFGESSDWIITWEYINFPNVL